MGPTYFYLFYTYLCIFLTIFMYISTYFYIFLLISTYLVLFSTCRALQLLLPASTNRRQIVADIPTNSNKYKANCSKYSAKSNNYSAKSNKYSTKSNKNSAITSITTCLQTGYFNHVVYPSIEILWRGTTRHHTAPHIPPFLGSKHLL